MGEGDGIHGGAEVGGDPERIRTADLWLDRPVC